MARDYKKIKAWQMADRLTAEIYRLTKKYPREEMYGLVSQIRRAVVSVPANIAEGSARNSDKEYLQFLYIARGSLVEAEYLIYLSRNLGYVSDREHAAVEIIRQECAKVLWGLIKAIEN